ncbi:zf-HC2 domain-containing protein [Polyangium sp. 6x1]|uniref:zf-HC2 domain-containing protein n=1 Tax=Polyangium sp. 6x1 TaxID=3042689 RepID=UPI00248328E1|nr:zf-HC2 domain-containing protein [Polyangium sp. 6x1]MDI1445977.1 zf-HC2 domain-containing protein [Polyangium sp. 6x1]
MSDCHAEAVEAFFRGELAPEASARVAAHVEVCRNCKEEMAWLEREKRVFSARAAAFPPPPPFEAVLARARASERVRPIAEAPRSRAKARGRLRSVFGWAGPGFVLAAAAALLVLLAWPREEAPPLTAEPSATAHEDARAGETCYACASAVVPSAEPEPEEPSGCMSQSCVTCSEDGPQEE